MFGFVRRRLVKAALSRGLFGDSTAWLVVAIVMGARFVVRKLSGDGPQLLFSEELGPHDTLVITAVEPGS
jgi:hypothetical protein